MKSATHGARLSALTSRQQDKLATDICKLNRSRQARHVYAEFVRLVDEKLGYYRILRDGYGALGPAAKELKQLETNARLVATHLENIDPDLASSLALSLWHLEGMKGSVPDESALDDDIKRMRNIAALAKIMSTPTRKKIGGNHAPIELAGLISDVATAYASSFGERPSSNRNGVFANILKSIFKAANIPNAPSESRLKTVLTKLKFVGMPVLRRGRKTK